jgi:hypothetical protein
MDHHGGELWCQPQNSMTDPSAPSIPSISCVVIGAFTSSFSTTPTRRLANRIFTLVRWGWPTMAWWAQTGPELPVPGLWMARNHSPTEMGDQGGSVVIAISELHGSPTPD